MTPRAVPRLTVPTIDRFTVSLREKVAHAVRAGLITGELHPGEVYSAPELAAQLGVSVTPVREALLDLAKEGLVEPIRNKGYLVTELSDHDLDEIYRLRVMLEVPAAGELARTASPARVRELRPMALAIEEAAQCSDLISYVEADRQFHLALLGLLGFGRLVAMVDSLRSQVKLYGLAELAANGTLIVSAKEHRSLLHLIGRRRVEDAEALMLSHLGHTRGIWAAHQEKPS